MDYEAMKRLEELHVIGSITDSEYEVQKAALMQGQAPTIDLRPVQPQTLAIQPMTAQPPLPVHVRDWAMFLHLSLLAGFVIPLGGLIVPLVIWKMKKDELPGIDAHGRIIANWLISLLIYSFISVVLAFVLVGFATGVALAIASVVFPIIAALKAQKGETWKYPLSLKFL